MTTLMTPITSTKCTLYTAGAFGITRTECRKLAVEEVETDIFRSGKMKRVTWTEKGKRKGRRMNLTNNVFVLVLDGHGTPMPPSALEDTGHGVKTTKFTCFDPRIKTEFNEMINPRLYDGSSGYEVLFDQRD